MDTYAGIEVDFFLADNGNTVTFNVTDISNGNTVSFLADIRGSTDENYIVFANLPSGNDPNGINCTSRIDWIEMLTPDFVRTFI